MKNFFLALCVFQVFGLFSQNIDSNYFDSNSPNDSLLKENTFLNLSSKAFAQKQREFHRIDFGSIYYDKKTRASYNWREIGPVNRPGGPGTIRMRGTGRLVFVEFDKINNRVFTGSSLGGLWFSEDLGKSWKNGGTDFLPEIGVSHIQIAPNVNNGKTWFIATGDGDADFNPSNGIWRTKDKGENWEPINFGLDIGENFPPPFWSRCRKILIHPENGNILYAAFRHGIYKTKNALDSIANDVIWERVADKSTMTEFFDLAFKPGSNGSVVIVSGNKVALSYQYGEKGTFSLVPNFESLTKRGNELISLRLSSANPDLIYGAYPGYIFSYSLSNEVAKTIRVGDKYKRSQAFAVSPFNANEFVFGNVQGIYLTQDLGESQSRKPKKSFAYHDDIHFLSYRDSNEIWMANDGGICRSLDKGNTWEDLTNGIGAAVYYNIGTSERRPDLIIGGGWDTGPNIYFAETDTFQTFNIFGDAFESLIDDTNPEKPIFYVSTQPGMARFDNSLVKAEFTRQPGGHLKGKRNWTHEFVKDPNLQTTLYYSGMPAIGRSLDGGKTWENIISNPQTENKARFFDGIWHSPTESGYVYVLQNSKDADDTDGLVIWKTKNANSVDPKMIVWEKMKPKIWGFRTEISKQYSVTDLTIDPLNSDHIWICISGYNSDIPKVLEYNGRKWRNATGKGLESVNATRIIAQKKSDGMLYLGSHSGVYFKKGKSKSWTKLEGLPHAKVTDMEINQCAELLRVSTLGRGIWETNLEYEQETITIEKDAVWLEDKIISGRILIKAGTELTIKSNVFFHNQSIIVIEKGARLLLDAAVLQSYCNGYWGGINIKGYKWWSENFNDENHLVLKNGAKIEDLGFK